MDSGRSGRIVNEHQKSYRKLCISTIKMITSTSLTMLMVIILAMVFTFIWERFIISLLLCVVCGLSFVFLLNNRVSFRHTYPLLVYAIRNYINGLRYDLQITYIRVDIILKSLMIFCVIIIGLAFLDFTLVSINVSASLLKTIISLSVSVTFLYTYYIFSVQNRSYMKLKDVEILKNVLSKLSLLSGLITEYNNHKLLSSICWNELKQKQNIVILSSMAELPYHLNIGLHKITAYIIFKDDQYLTVIANHLLKRLYFIHTGSQSNGFKQYPNLSVTFTTAFHTHEITDVFCSTQDGCNSLAQAYINARVFSWGMRTLDSRSKVDQFLEKVSQHPILFKENAAQMYLYSDFVNFSEKKQMVKDIVGELIRRGKTILTVEKMLTTEGLCKYRHEKAFIKEHYIKHCLKQYLTEIEDLFNCQDPLNLASTLKNIKDFSDLRCKPFKDVQSYILVEGCERDISECRKRRFVEKLLRNCWDILSEKCVILQREASFIDELVKCIKESFEKNEDFFSKFDISIAAHSSTENTLKQILDKLKGESEKTHSTTQTIVNKSESFDALNEIALHLHGRPHSTLFLQSFEQVVNDVKERAKVTIATVNNETYISFRKSYAHLNDAIKEIMDEINNQQKSLDDINEIRIFANELLIANDSFHWYGTNVVIASKKLYIAEGQSCVWNVSGRSASNHQHKKAPDGKQSGDNGSAGEHGCHGQSSGNILIITDHIVNAENLTIVSNGGDGSDGQHGGDGRDGEDGKDGFGLDRETFKSRYPDPAVFLNPLNTTSERTMKESRKNAKRVIMSIKYDNHYGEYCELETNDDNNVKMAVFAGRCTQSYCFHKGAKGGKAKKGGDGGSGGKAGLGGYSGVIQFVGFTSGKECGFNKIVQRGLNGSDGNEGRSGNGGNGGKNGKKGMDNARITEYAKTQTQWFHGHLEVKYHDTWNNKHYYAWCPKHEKYARIHKVSPPRHPGLAERGSDGANTKSISGETQTQRRRQAAILSNEIVRQFRHEVDVKLTNQRALQDTTNTLNMLKGMARVSIGSSSRSLQHIHRQTSVIPKDEDISNTRQLDIPNFESTPDEKIYKETTNTGKMQRVPDNSELNSIIESCNENDSFENWFNQLRRLSQLLQSPPKELRSRWLNIFRTKPSIDYTYSAVLQFLQRFTKHLQDNVPDKDILVDIYDLIKVVMSKVQKQDHGFKVQLILELETIQTIVLCKQKFALVKDIYKRLVMSCNSWFEYSTNTAIRELDSLDRDKMMQYCIQEALLRAIRDLQDGSSIDELIEIHETIRLKIESNGDDIFNDLLQSENPHSDDTGTPNSSEFNVDDSDSNNTDDGDGQDEFEQHMPKQYADIVKPLMFHDVIGMQLLRHVICDRLACEGSQISTTILKRLMSIVIGIENTFTVSALTVMLAVNQPKVWLLETIVMQMRIMMDLSTQEETSARNLLDKVDYDQWLLLISQKLEQVSDESSLSFPVIEEILELMQTDLTGHPDESALCRLMNSPLSEWPAQLQWRQEFLVLQSIPVNFTCDEQKVQTAQYLWALRNRYGDEFITKLQNSVCKHAQVHPDAFTKLLLNLYNNKWSGDNTSFKIIAQRPCNKWATILDNYSAKASKSTRSIDTLFEILESVKNSSFPKENFEEVKKMVLEVYSMENSESKILGGQIEQFECHDVTKWCELLKSSEVKENIPEVLAVIKQGIYLKTGCSLRDTQLIAIVLFLFNEEKGMLEQVSTGEGKSYIIAALAIFKSLSGSKVDIITSSSVLAKRDASENREIYKLFGATVSHNCCEDTEERKRAYKAAIVYGEIGCFQRDILLDEFYNENIMGDRTSENVIVDEVDSMLLDKGQSVLYLSHDVSGLDSLHQVYVHIWSFVHSKGLYGTTDDENAVYEGMLDALFGIFRADDIEKAWFTACTLTSNELDILWSGMRDKNLIDKSGRVLVDNDVIKTVKTFGLSESLSIEKQGVDVCVKNALLEAIAANGKIGKDDIQNKHDKLMAENLLTKDQIRKLHQGLVHQRVIDHEGIIQDKETIMANERIVTLPEITEPQDPFLETRMSNIVICITNALKDSIRRGTALCVPNYLKAFIRQHLRTWISNAFKARFLSESEHYIVDVDRSTNYQNACNIVIMDTDTGTEQYNTQWNQGLHQFLQLKHGCRISSESLKAVFMSNISFFKRYDKQIYGLTGTLGSEGERRLLENLYSIDYVTIPTFRPSSFYEEDGMLCPTRDIWKDQIAQCVKRVHKSRPVLVICETIKDLKSIEMELKQTLNATLHVYKHSYEEPDIFKRDGGIEKDCIILATNLAGRGTDIKISEDTSDSGGLFVCLTYLPNNIRVEQQAFGRTARKGQQGSGQMIILDEELDARNGQTQSVVKFVNLKARRDIKEKQRIGKIQTEYENRLKVEEQCFQKFENKFTSFTEAIKQRKQKESDKVEVPLLLQVLLDKWALWLDAHADKLVKRDSQQSVNESFKTFLTTIDDATSEIRENTTRYEYIDCFANRIRLGKMFIVQKEFDKAHNLFDDVIRTEPKFSETAHYYTVHCLMKKKDILRDDASKASCLKHLHQSKHLMQKRIDELQNATVIVQSLSNSYTNAQNSYLVIDEYKKQNEGVINLYNVFIRSIDDILGHEITPVIIEDITQDPLKSKIIHDDLLANHCLTSYALGSDYNESIQELRDEYALYIDQLKLIINRLKSVHANDFASLLPNREEFWTDLQNVNILYKVEEIVLIDIKRLNEIRFPTKGKILKEYIHITSILYFAYGMQQPDTAIWLYPELNQQQKEYELMIPRQQFERSFGSVQCWEALENTNVIKLIKSAEVNQNVDPCHVKLSHFDNIDDNAFTIIDGVNDEASKNIFQQLIEQGVLSRDVPTRLLRRDIQDLHLRSYGCYQTEVINVILMRYQYRIALEDLINNERHTLPSKPHIMLFEKLIKHNVVIPIRVAHDFNDESLLLEKLYGSDEPYTGDRLDNDGEYKAAFLQRCPSVREKEIQQICNAHSTSKKLLSDFMSERKILVEWSGLYKIICTEKHIKEMILPSKLKHLEYPLKNTLLAKCSAKSKHDQESLTMKLVSLQSGLHKYDTIDSTFKDLEEYIDEETILSMFREILGFSKNGLDQVIILHEQRWSLRCLMKIAGIIALGVLQIIAGIATELYTIGVGTHVASGLIAEGFADILFATQSLCTGYCSLTAYARQKAINLAITVGTQGIGAWYSRGAEFSNFGYKIGGEALSKMSGNRLIEEVGKKAIKGVGERAIMKQAVKKLGKKLVEPVALGLANAGIEYAIELVIRGQLQNVCNSSVADLVQKCDDHIKKHDIRKLAIRIRTQIGTHRAKKVINEICSKSIESTSNSANTNNQLSLWLPRVNRAISGGFDRARKKLQQTGDIRAQTISIINRNVSNALGIIKAPDTSISSIFKDSAVKQIAKGLEREIDRNEEDCMCFNPDEGDISEERFTNEVVADLKRMVREKIREKIECDVVKPIMHCCADKAIRYAGKAIKEAYHDNKTFYHWEEFEELQKKYVSGTHGQGISDIDRNLQCSDVSISTEYNEKLVQLLSKVRDPELFAHIIRQGVPVGIHCTQAVAEIMGCPIHIDVHGGGKSIILPNKFVPKGEQSSSKPLNLDYHVGENGVGHFRIKVKEEYKTVCLFDALKAKGHDICREDVASRIEADDNLMDLVKSGIHEHFIGKGGMVGPCKSNNGLLNNKFKVYPSVKIIKTTYGAKNRSNRRDKSAPKSKSTDISRKSFLQRTLAGHYNPPDLGQFRQDTKMQRHMALQAAKRKCNNAPAEHARIKQGIGKK